MPFAATPRAPSAPAIMATVLSYLQGVLALYNKYPYILFRVVTFNAAEFFIFDYFNDLVYYFYPAISPGIVGKPLLSLLKGCLAGILGNFLSQMHLGMRKAMDRTNTDKQMNAKKRGESKGQGRIDRRAVTIMSTGRVRDAIAKQRKH